MEHIADFVVLECSVIIGGEQISPRSISVDIVHRIGRSSQDIAGGIPIFQFGLNIACTIIGPDPGLSCLLVVFSDQLIGGIVNAFENEGVRGLTPSVFA